MTDKTAESRKAYHITLGSACDAPDHISDDSDYYSYPQTNLRFFGTYTEAEEKAKEMLQHERMQMINTELNTISITYWIEEV